MKPRMKFWHALISALLFLPLMNITIYSQGITIGTGTTFSLGDTEFSLSGNWNNEGTFNADSGTVVFNGPGGNQTITNSSGEIFYDMIIDKAAGDVQLANGMTLLNSLTVTSGDLDLNGLTLEVDSTALVSETPGNTIKGGTAETSTTLNAPNYYNICGLGAEFTTFENLGSTDLIRGHTQHMGIADSSILRYYDIHPTNNSGLGAEFLFHYDDSELNGLTESELVLYRSTDDGATWRLAGGDVNTTDNTVNLWNIDEFSRWTLANLSFGGVIDYNTDPLTAGHLIDSMHIQTATITQNGNPVEGVSVWFNCISGPNDTTAMWGVGFTDTNGQVSYPYSGTGGAGTDSISVRAVIGGTTFERMAVANWYNLTEWSTTITAENTSAESTEILHFGQSFIGTDGIDPLLGELELPPNPPQNAFDVRFILPGGSTASKKDYRDMDSTKIVWKLNLQTEPGTYPIILTWDPLSLAPGRYRLKDPFGGTIVNVNMKTHSSYSLTNTGISQLLIEFTGKAENDISITNDWNLISVPSIAPDMREDVLFPGNSSEAFWYSSGYVAKDTLELGKGYWLKFATAGIVSLIGAPVDTTAIVAQGWNLVGPFDLPVDVSKIGTTPAGILSSRFFGFDGSYFGEDSTLQPGKGYWIKTLQAGVIDYDPQVLVKVNTHITMPVINDDWAKLIVEDEGNKQMMLYLSSEKKSDAGFELPPVPPTGIFDVRYTNDKNVIGRTEVEDMLINYAEYPVTIKVEGTDVRIEDKIDGSMVNVVLEDGEELKISNRQLKQLAVSVVEIPISYELYQNYPNPFNPSTTIKFALPEDTRVKIIIYNILGESVKTLINKELKAGYHEEEFNASIFASGVYFYRIETGKFTNVKKMMLLK